LPVIVIEDGVRQCKRRRVRVSGERIQVVHKLPVDHSLLNLKSRRRIWHPGQIRCQIFAVHVHYELLQRERNVQPMLRREHVVDIGLANGQVPFGERGVADKVEPGVVIAVATHQLSRSTMLPRHRDRHWH
jgi:hypothetical protein